MHAGRCGAAAGKTVSWGRGGTVDGNDGFKPAGKSAPRLPARCRANAAPEADMSRRLRLDSQILGLRCGSGGLAAVEARSALGHELPCAW